MLPASPDTFGNLKAVFPAVLQSLAARNNDFGLKAVRHAIVVMIDGLGYFNLKQHAGEAPFLASALTDQPILYSGFPSSTVASIASLASGVAPDEHGLFGYRIFDRDLERECNLLSGMDKYSILDYLKREPLSSENPITAVTRPEYLDSGFSRATMTGETVTASAMSERVSIASKVSDGQSGLTYLYIPELDQAAHAHGVGSLIWIELLREVDELIKQLTGSVSSDVGVLVVADHGVVNVEPENHILLDEVIRAEDLLAVGGDPRAAFVYLKDQAKAGQRLSELQGWLGSRGAALSLEQMFTSGLFGPALRDEPDLLPDCVVLPAAGYACYHVGFAKATSMRMIGQHGGLSATECALPFIRLGAYCSSSDFVP